MRKVLLTILIECMGFVAAHATTAISLDEKTISIQKRTVVGVTPDRPRYPMVIAAYYFYYDSDLSALSIYTPAWHYPYFAVLENFTTGESNYYSYDDLLEEEMSIPFTGGPGIWRLSLGSAVPHDPRILTEWYFTIENGKITYVKSQPRWNF